MYTLLLAPLQDEAGSNAFFATQLDESLGGAPVQHREVQGEESEGFLKVGLRSGSAGLAITQFKQQTASCRAPSPA